MRPASGWCGVVVGRDGRPVVQGKGDPWPGHLVSPTALFDPAYPKGDPRRYLDAETVPYLVVPTRLLARRGGPLRLGDLGLIAYRDRSTPAVVGEVGPGCCEISIAAALALRIPASPRHGGVRTGVTYRVWPGSAAIPPWPRGGEEIAPQVASVAAPSSPASARRA